MFLTKKRVGLYFGRLFRNSSGHPDFELFLEKNNVCYFLATFFRGKSYVMFLKKKTFWATSWAIFSANSSGRPDFELFLENNKICYFGLLFSAVKVV
jgi:hypothetical protein